MIRLSVQLLDRAQIATLPADRKVQTRLDRTRILLSSSRDPTPEGLNPKCNHQRGPNTMRCASEERD
eukprot:8598363-Alexandrium_andersonii.AAC.1